MTNKTTIFLHFQKVNSNKYFGNYIKSRVRNEMTKKALLCYSGPCNYDYANVAITVSSLLLTNLYMHDVYIKLSVMKEKLEKTAGTATLLEKKTFNCQWVISSQSVKLNACN